MDHQAELRQLRESVAAAALEAARELEAGRAQAPFQQQLNALAGDDSSAPIRAAILASSPEIARDLLAEFVGADYNVCKVILPSRLGYSEVLLQERGFLLDAGAGAREFEDAGAFVAALQETHALHRLDAADLEPLRVKLKGPAHLSGLCLLIPQDLDALTRRPALLSLLADQADWVFLAGGPDTLLSDAQRQTIQLVLDHVAGVQHVLAAPEGTPAAAKADGWWKQWRVPLSLGLVRLGSDLLRTRLSLLTDPGSQLRRYLIERRRWRELDTTLALIEQESQQSQRLLANRLQLAREGLVGGATAELRKAVEPIRARLAEECEQLLKAHEREGKGLLAAESPLGRELRQTAAQIAADDIEQDAGGAVIRLSLQEQVNQRLMTGLQTASRRHLETGYRTLRDGLECSVRDAEGALEKVLGARYKLAVELPNEATIWDAVATVARPEIRYRGEMPKPTLASRFGSARQSIMSLMILGTLLSGVAAFTGGEDTSGARTWLYALMLPLLVIGFLWTYVSFRKKEQLALEKEVEKLQEGVASELRRVVQDMCREQQTVLAAAVQRAQRTAQQQMDAAVERVQQQRQGEAEEQRRRQGEQQRFAEQRLARLRTLGQQLVAHRGRSAQAEKFLSQWLGDWIAQFNQEPR